MSNCPELDQILAMIDRACPSPTSYSSANNNSNSNAHGYSSQQSYSSYSNVQCSGDNPNGCTPDQLAPSIPLDQYRLNEDPCPEIIRKKPSDRVTYTQNIAVRYLKPPAPAPAGDIVIQQLPDRQVAPAPPLHVRQQQPSRPNPAPLVVREAPPPPPPQVPGQFHQIPGKVIPPPARKVITEYLPPCPPKPQQVIIERWLPYEAPQQKVVYQPAKPPCLIPDPKNVNIIWSEPDVNVCQVFVNLGVHNTDPNEYVCKYGSSLIQPECLPEIAIKWGARGCHQLARDQKKHPAPVLYGDVEYLRLINNNNRQQQQCY